MGTSIQDLSDDELRTGIEVCYQTWQNASSRGQADDYMVGSLQLAKAYQLELERRAKKKGATL